MKEHARTSYAFLMEMMWVCAFFLICACIFVMAFAKAEQMSRLATTRNRAALAAGNAMEDLFAVYGVASVSCGEGDELHSLMKDSAAEMEKAHDGDDFTLQITFEVEEGLLRVSILACDRRSGETLISLDGARAVPAHTVDGALPTAEGVVSPNGEDVADGGTAPSEAPVAASAASANGGTT